MSISIDDFKKVEIKIGQILSAEKVPETDKLLKLSVDFGINKTEIIEKDKEGKEIKRVVEQTDIRQIISGISLYFPDLTQLVGKKCAFVTNLEPRTIKGLQSNGMILAVSSDSAFSLIEPISDIPLGTQVK